MNGLCGFIEPALPAARSGDLLGLMAQCLPFAAAGPAEIGRSGCGAVAASGGTSGACACIDAHLAVIVGAPRWRDAKYDAISRDRGPAMALLAAHADHGSSLLDRLAGSFAFAILDCGTGDALLAIDRMGIGRLCYGETDEGGLAFGSSTDSVCQHPGISRDISPQGVFNYLFHYVSPAPRTIFAGIQKLQASHCLEWTGGTATVRRYWKLDYALGSAASAESLEREIVETLHEAVARAAEGVDLSRVGAFLSGGLDSSTVSGLLSKLTPAPARTFTIGFDLEGYDESGFADIAARHFGTDHNLYYVTPQDVFDLVPRIAAEFDEPFGNSSAVPTYFCARLAREKGVDTLFAGDGGDEIFCGNERYIDHRKYDRFLQSPPLFQKAVLGLLATLPGSIRTVRRARNYMNVLNTPLPDRLYYMVAQQGRAPTDLFEAEFVARIDAQEPVGIARDLYADSDPRLDVMQRMMLVDQQLTLADNDLRKVENACALAGVQVRYPFLDDELVALSGRIPPKMHTKSGILRQFFKEALRDFLPPAVIAKKKHGFGLPTEHWLRDFEPLRTLCTEAVTAFGGRGVIRPAFAVSLTDELATGSRPELLSMCWDVMILELWLQARNLDL